MTTPEEFEKLVHRLHEKAFYAKDGLTGSYGEEYDAVLAAYRAAWENRVPEKTMTIYAICPEGIVRIMEHIPGTWAAAAQQAPFRSAFGATPALALEAWRKENEK